MNKDLELQEELQEELPEWYTVSEFKKECKETRLKLQQYIEKNVRETEVFKEFQDKVLKIFYFDDALLANKFIFSWSYVNDGEYRLDSGVLDWMKYFLYYLKYNNKLNKVLTDIGFFKYRHEICGEKMSYFKKGIGDYIHINVGIFDEG